MKQLFYILPLFLFASCASIRKTHTSTLAVHDTVVTKVHDTLIQEKVTEKTVRVHDTVVTTAGYFVSDTFDLNQLKPGKTASGHKSQQGYAFSQGNLHGFVTVDTAGQVIFSCKEDSLKIVIQNLTSIIERQQDSLTRLEQSSNTSRVDTTKTDVITTTKIKSVLPYFIGVIILFVVAEVGYWAYKKYVKF